jgi:HD-GYP domain-containing protein (c-di-GMP phosphodiesterase class II)
MQNHSYLSDESADGLREEAKEYLEIFPEMQGDIEQNVVALNRNPRDKGQLNSLFRALHTLKSNAAMCNLNALVDVLHPLEDLIGEVRSEKLQYSPLLSELILLLVDRAKLTAQTLEAHRQLEPLNLPEIKQQLQTMISSQATSQFEHLVRHMIDFMTGQSSSNQIIGTESLVNDDIYHQDASTFEKEDLRFFRGLSLQLERRSTYWQGRTQRQLQLALQTNEAAGSPIDSIQLEAAIYTHDLGMALLPETIWIKQGRFDDRELKELQAHPHYGAGILERIPKWEESAEIVLQHHERPNGEGYPLGLSKDQIHPGAQLIAILDAFEAMTHERIDRPYKKSVIRAITELNACPDQFAQDWVKVFNNIIRKILS